MTFAELFAPVFPVSRLGSPSRGRFVVGFHGCGRAPPNSGPGLWPACAAAESPPAVRSAPGLHGYGAHARILALVLGQSALQRQGFRLSKTPRGTKACTPQGPILGQSARSGKSSGCLKSPRASTGCGAHARVPVLGPPEQPLQSRVSFTLVRRMLWAIEFRQPPCAMAWSIAPTNSL